jgi:hypothetical protein
MRDKILEETKRVLPEFSIVSINHRLPTFETGFDAHRRSEVNKEAPFAVGGNRDH